MKNKSDQAFLNWYSKDRAISLWENKNGDEIIKAAWDAALDWKKESGEKQRVGRATMIADLVKTILDQKNSIKILCEVLLQVHKDANQEMKKKIIRVIAKVDYRE